VSGDTSRPSGYRLENPARTGGVANGAVSGRQQPAPPSWLKVIGTTIRLWLRRRVLHVPDSGKIGRARVRLGALLAVVVVLVGGGVAAAVALTARSPATGSGTKVTAVRPKLTPAEVAAQAAAAAAALANGNAAATWIAAQVARGRVIGCDPATCAAILTAGYPDGGQVVLQQGVGLPGPGALIVASAAVRALYGAQLGSSAPAVIAAFGTGAAAVQVRLAVAGGPAAYGHAVSTARADRRRAGQRLLQMRHVHARPAAKSELRSGLVDPRLTVVLRRLAAHYPVTLLRCSDAGPLAGRSVPLRMAEIAVPATRHGKRTVTELAGMEKLLRKLPAVDRAELMPVHAAHGKVFLELRFRAPSPL